MKKFLTIIIIASFSVAGCYTPGHVAQPDNYNYSDNYNNAELTYQTFYDELQPYGAWFNHPEYGYVWQPHVRGGFRPYQTAGRWVSTVDGWAWASDYNWGWAPFHYGRWFFDPSIGWAWVPGYDWAPAWVTWGQYGDYYAWAPLAPGINIRVGNTWRAPANYWCFVPRNYVNYANLDRFAGPSSNTNVNNITIINNYNSYDQKEYYHRGPDYQEVQRFTSKPIIPVDIATTDRPGLSRVINEKFQVFRPTISANSATNNGQISGPNKIRPYNGAIRGNSQNETSKNVPGNNRLRKNPNLNELPARGNRGGLSNGINNRGSNVSQEDIDNTNRRLQQQQMERIRNLRMQQNNPASQQYPKNNQQNNQENDFRQPTMRNTFPADDSRPVRQPALPNERSIQRPALPPQNERMMRSPQAPPMPGRVESRGAGPVRSIPGRPGNLPQRP